MTQQNVLVEVALPLLLWKEDKQFVAFTPALDLSTCGESEQDAVLLFSEAVELFFETAIERHTLHDLLESLGWSVVLNSWHPPSQALAGSKSYSVRIPVPSVISAQ